MITTYNILEKILEIPNLSKKIKTSNVPKTLKHQGFYLARCKGLGSLRSPLCLLRKLSDYRLLLTRLRLAKDFGGSNPLFNFFL